MTRSDDEIIKLYNCRDEKAISYTDEKYHHYLYKIAYNILKNNEDSEENLSDTYMKTWNAIPPERPSVFSAFLAKICRNGAISAYRKNTAKRRSGSEYDLCLNELEETISTNQSVEDIVEMNELINSLTKYLEKQSEKKRVMFVRRYFYMDSIADIAKLLGVSESSVKTTLHRMRNEIVLE